MRRFPPFTFLGLLLAAASLDSSYAHTLSWPAILSAAAYGLTLLEFKKYTGRFQFIMILVNGLLLALHLQLGILMITALFVVALVTNARQAFMQRFTYVNLLWIEPLLLVFSGAMIAYVDLKYATHWPQWFLPLLPYGFACGLVFGYVQDGLRIKKHVAHGYRIQVGDVAPDFELPDEQGTLHRLSDLRGCTPVLLLFVRGDWCPGCHMMLRTYERHREVFQRKGIVLLAIGPDTVAVNHAMARRLGVNYHVLADVGQQVTDRYGVIYSNPIVEVGIDYAKGIPLPAAFLIDGSGVVRYVSRPERVGEFLRPELVFDALDRMPDLPRAA